MKFLDVPQMQLVLNQDTRDYALVQLLIHVGVNQFLLKGIYGRVHSMAVEEVEKVVKEIESIEAASVYDTLGKHAVEKNLTDLSSRLRTSEDRQE